MSSPQVSALALSPACCSLPASDDVHGQTRGTAQRQRPCLSQGAAGQAHWNSSWLPFSPSFGLSQTQRQPCILSSPGRPQVPGTEKAPQTQVLQPKKGAQRRSGRQSPEIPKGAALTGSLDGQSSPSSYSEGHGVSPGMSAEPKGRYARSHLQGDSGVPPPTT